jgi:hypothetical protein
VSPKSLLPVETLLLLCARTTVNKDAHHKIEGLLETGVNWDKFVEQAEVHSISPLIYRTLSTLDTNMVPEKVIKALEKSYLETVGSNMLLFHELGKILRAFKNAEIDVICLKGSSLAEGIYRNIGLRILRDIDLLIKEEDLATATRELVSLQYMLLDIYPTKWHERWWTVLCEDRQARYANVEKGCMLEIHWNIQPISDSSPVDIAAFWDNAQQVTIAGVETLMFSPEDLIHHLCLHAYKHATKRSLQLKWYCDIAEVIRQSTVDWDYLMKQSTKFRTEAAVYPSLYVVATYLGVHIPPSVFDALGQDVTIEFESMLRTALNPPAKKKIARRTINLGSVTQVEGTSNRLHILVGEVFPSREFIAHHYRLKSKRAVYFYYPVHFGTVLHKVITAVQRMLKKKKSKKVDLRN